MNIDSCHYISPIVTLEIRANECYCLSIQFIEETNYIAPKSSILQLCHNQLDNYFNAINLDFDIPLYIQGTSFQQSVWNALMQIPTSLTYTYSDIAKMIHRSNAFRAIGQACNANPFAIVIPCHRIISKNGKLTGYNAGIERKAWLLEHESNTLLHSTFKPKSVC